MSRLGKIPIPLQGAEVKVDPTTRKVSFKGSKGNLELYLPLGYEVKVEGGALLLLRDEKGELNNAEYGLYRSLIKNAIIGVTTGYEVKLVMIGVGYRAALQGTTLDLQVGYSHPTRLTVPQNLSITIDKGTTIVVKGIDKAAVGQFAATIRAMKPPEPYKGKGIRYENEYVRKKEGKAKAKA